MKISNKHVELEGRSYRIAHTDSGKILAVVRKKPDGSDGPGLEPEGPTARKLIELAGLVGV